MLMNDTLSRPGDAGPRRRRGDAGFTVLEVAMAAFVMLLGISSSILVLRQGFDAIDSARKIDLAGQVLQSAMEDLRLKNWAQLTDPNTMPAAETGIDLDQTFPGYSTYSAAALRDFTLKRTINTVTRTLKAGATDSELRELVLVVSWKATRGGDRSLRLSTYYTKSGLHDYFSTSR